MAFLSQAADSFVEHGVRPVKRGQVASPGRETAMLAALMLAPVAMAMVCIVIFGAIAAMGQWWLTAINMVEIAVLVGFSVRYIKWLWRITEK